jgi:phosphoglycolate phosphatase
MTDRQPEPTVTPREPIQESKPESAQESAHALPNPPSHAPFSGAAVRAVIIDLDGTMVDTVDDFTAALATMLKTFALPTIERDEVAGYVGKGSEHLIQAVLAARLALPDATQLYPAAYEAYQSEYANINGRFSRPFPEVSEGLEALRAMGLPLACVTNKPHAFARELLAHFNLLDHFAVVLGGDSLPLKKPDPLPMLKACEQLGVLPQATLAIGDSANDAAAAWAAGMPCLLVPYGYNHGQPIQSVNSDGIVTSILDAARLIASDRKTN